MRGRGVEKSYLDLTLGLQRLGVDVHLILREAELLLDVSEVENLHILEKSGEVTPAHLGELLRQLHEAEPIDLIISSNLSYLEKSGFIHPNIWYSVNMSWGTRLLKRWRFRKWFEVRKGYRGKKIIAVSEGVKHDLLKTLRVKPAAIEVIYDPYDIAGIQSLAVEPIDFPGSRPYIVHVGAFDKIKRHDLLLKAFIQISENVDLYLIGEGRERKRIEKLAKRLGLEDRIFFLGWRQNPYPWIANAKATVLSSDSEALPRVLIESLIVGTVPVSTDCKYGPSEILRGELARFLAKPGDAKDLAQKIETALKDPPKISPSCYEAFDQKLILQKYLKLIDID